MCRIFYTILFIVTIVSDAFAKDKCIPVFFASDDGYAPYTATAMASVLKNTKSCVDFYVLSNNISMSNKEKIKNTKKFFPNNSFSIKIIDVDIKKFLKFNEGFDFITKTVYAKWLVPEIGKDLDKVIFLDGDIIVQRDISELYNENLDGEIIGAVPDMTDIVLGKSRHELLKKYNAYKNIEVWNAGVYLIDTNKWREKDITNKLIAQKEKILSYDRKNNIKTGSADQDVVNIVLQDYKVLDFKYNTHPSAVEKCDKFNTCSKFFKKNKDDLLKDALVIHYSSNIKPWHYKESLYAKKFWEIVQYTDFAKDINGIYNRNSTIKKISTSVCNSIVNDYNKKKVRRIYILLGVMFFFNIAMLFSFILFFRKRSRRF